MDEIHVIIITLLVRQQKYNNIFSKSIMKYDFACILLSHTRITFHNLRPRTQYIFFIVLRLLYLQGDNSDIVATDSQKNTVYLLAKKHGVGNPEQFAILVAKHFLQTYDWVIKAEVIVEDLKWSRVRETHVHAFIAVPTYTRWAKVLKIIKNR